MPDPEPVKWYTRARHIPTYIGKTASGERLWGGPYSLPQIGVGIGVLLLDIMTAPLWTPLFDVVVNVFIFLSTVLAAVMLSSRIPPGTRNPIWKLTAWLNVMTAPRGGTIDGQPLTIPRPTLVCDAAVIWGRPQHLDLIGHAAAQSTIPDPAVRPDDVASTATQAAPQPRSLTSVQLLLAQTKN